GVAAELMQLWSLARRTTRLSPASLVAGSDECEAMRLVAHELSFQKDGRVGNSGGRVVQVIIAPPQDGQRSSACSGAAASCSASGLDEPASSLRQRASLVWRWPLARKP